MLYEAWKVHHVTLDEALIMMERGYPTEEFGIVAVKPNPDGSATLHRLIDYETAENSTPFDLNGCMLNIVRG